MTTTDDKTPDPTPALLPPARLAEIREREAAATKGPWRAGVVDKDRVFVPYAGALEGPNGERVILRMNAHFPFEADAAFVAHAREDVRALLAHLDALTPRAPVDGNAGRRLYYALHPTAHERAWESHDAELRARYDAQAAALHAIGHAAGRSEGEAEPYVCPCCYHQRGDEVPADGRSTREEMAATIARLTTALVEEQDAHRESSRLLADRLADLKRVEGELAAERALSEELRAMEVEATASADRWRAASERHEREAAEVRATIASIHEQHEEERADMRREIEQGESMIASAAADHEQARLDGAREGDATGRREEREVIANELRANGWDAAADLVMDPTEDIRAALARERADGAREEREALITDAAAHGFHATANFIRTRARATEGGQGS